MATNDALDFVGYWKITDMEVWAPKYIDIVVPGFIEFNYEDDLLTGKFQFGTVSGELDCALRDVDGITCVEWSWEGQNDTSTALGRGWARLVDGELTGRIFIHGGDNSAFRARRKREPRAPRMRRQAKSKGSSKPH